jgi:hypothetical protein
MPGTASTDIKLPEVTKQSYSYFEESVSKNPINQIKSRKYK